MRGFRLLTEPWASFFRKTQPSPSLILEKLFFTAENHVFGSNENHTLLSLRTMRTKKQTQTTEPTQRRKKDHPKKIRDKPAREGQAFASQPFAHF
jgi:hypothetical protein